MNLNSIKDEIVTTSLKDNFGIDNDPEFEVYLGRTLKCIQRHSNPSKIGYSFYRLTQMFWAIIGQSDWQLARQDLIKEVINKRHTCIDNKSIPYKKKDQAEKFLVDGILTILTNLSNGPNIYKKKLIELEIQSEKEAYEEILKLTPQKVKEKITKIEEKYQAFSHPKQALRNGLPTKEYVFVDGYKGWNENYSWTVAEVQNELNKINAEMKEVRSIGEAALIENQKEIEKKSFEDKKKYIQMKHLMNQFQEDMHSLDQEYRCRFQATTMA